MPRPRDFRGGKGAWLSSRQNPAEMSGGLSKAKYERLNYLVSQNTILYDGTCIRLCYAPSCSRFFMMLCTQKRYFHLHLLLEEMSIAVNNCLCTNKT